MKKRASNISQLKDRLIEFDTLPSTNEYCKKEQVNGKIVVAKKQTNGHGRMGRSFFSEDGGLYVSFCYELNDVLPEHLIPITGMCAVAVIRAIVTVCKISPSIKWTNDILLQNKKICGILAETVFSNDLSPEKLIIGIGINLNQAKKSFDGELKNIASSIYALTGKRTDKKELLKVLASEVDKAAKIAVSPQSECDLKNEYVKEYRKNCITLGKEIHILKQSLAPDGIDPKVAFSQNKELFPTAIAVDIDENFGLLVQNPDKTFETIVSGEVSVR